MNPHYVIRDPSNLFSPCLVFYKELIRHNIAHMIELAGRARAHFAREVCLSEHVVELDAGARDDDATGRAHRVAEPAATTSTLCRCA